MTSPSITVYGIANCDNVKKSRNWFTGQGLEYRFHDFNKQGLPADRLPAWMAAVGWDKLLNRQGTTWRKLDPATQAAVRDEATASAVMQARHSIIKRPVVEWQLHGATHVTHVSLGFVPDQWQTWAAGRPGPDGAPARK